MTQHQSQLELSEIWDDFFNKQGLSPKEMLDILRGEVRKEQKLTMARDALLGLCFKQNDETIQPYISDAFQVWFRWVQSSDTSAVTWWHWIHEAKPDDDSEGRKEPTITDRDEYMIELWHTINDPDGDNKAAKKQIEEEVTDWSYYQNYFFNWFLNRFDIIRAREVFAKFWFRRYAHIPVSLASIAAVSGYFICDYHQDWEWISFALIIFSVFLIGWGITRFKIGHYFQSLTPRLAITTGIGYLFLLSANNLVSLIYANTLPLTAQIFICIALTLGVWIYVIQIIQRRVKPVLRLWQAVKRSFHLMLLGAAYSAIGLFLTAPIMFHPIMLSDKVSETHPESGMFLLIIAVLALAFGIVLQLVWEDKPVTEPL